MTPHITIMFRVSNHFDFFFSRLSSFKHLNQISISLTDCLVKPTFKIFLNLKNIFQVNNCELNLLKLNLSKKEFRLNKVDAQANSLKISGVIERGLFTNFNFNNLQNLSIFFVYYISDADLKQLLVPTLKNLEIYYCSLK